MAADPSHRRAAKVALTWAVAEIALGIAALLVTAHRDTSPAAVHRPPAITAPAPVTVQPSRTAPLATAPPGAAPAAVVQAGSAPTSAAITAEPDSTPPRADGDVAAPAVSVSCHPDLALDAAPDAAYSFLCSRGPTPISWPTDSLHLFTSGLTPTQSAALSIALEQWQVSARFTVTRVSRALDADVIVTATALTNNEDGYTAMHYVCAAECAYDHADVQLASNVELTKTSWISTILHELGHVAGLNHVARHSEVMYPEIDARSPVLYGSGDLEGFRALEEVRSAP